MEVKPLGKKDGVLTLEVALTNVVYVFDDSQNNI